MEFSCLLFSLSLFVFLFLRNMLICLVMQSSSIAAVSVMEKHERKAFAVALSSPSVQSAIRNHHGTRKENTVCTCLYLSSFCASASLPERGQRVNLQY